MVIAFHIVEALFALFFFRAILRREVKNIFTPRGRAGMVRYRSAYKVPDCANARVRGTGNRSHLYELMWGRVGAVQS